MKCKDIDWSEPHDDIDFSCPYCGGEGVKCWEDLDESEKEAVIEDYGEFREWCDLDPEEQTLVTLSYCGTEDRNESDKLHPMEEDVIDHYGDNMEKFKFTDDDEVEDFYRCECANFNFYCDMCECDLNKKGGE